MMKIYHQINMKKTTLRFSHLLIVLGSVLPMGRIAAQSPLQITGPAIPALMMGAATWADYDSDGFDDLLICGLDSNETTRTILLHSTGSSLVPVLGTPFAPVALGDAAWGDMDHDGDPDLALTGERSPGNRVTAIYQNNGGTFTQLATPNLPGLTNSRLRWADLDGDGDLDLFLTGHSLMDGLTGIIARNDGGGTFAKLAAPGYDTRDWPALTIADYDGDGRLDIAYHDISPKLSEGMRTVLLHNNGGMQFSISPASATLPQLYGGSLDFADVDGDGDLDLVCSGMGNAPRTEIHKNVGGSFVPLQGATNLLQLAMGEAKWADLDGDGDPDMVVAGRGDNGPETMLYLNQGGHLVAAQGPTGMPKLYNVRIAYGDWDGDSDRDMVFLGQDMDDRPACYIGTWNASLSTFEF